MIHDLVVTSTTGRWRGGRIYWQTPRATWRRSSLLFQCITYNTPLKGVGLLPCSPVAFGGHNKPVLPADAD